MVQSRLSELLHTATGNSEKSGMDIGIGLSRSQISNISRKYFMTLVLVWKLKSNCNYAKCIQQLHDIHCYTLFIRGLHDCRMCSASFLYRIRFITELCVGFGLSRTSFRILFALKNKIICLWDSHFLGYKVISAVNYRVLHKTLINSRNRSSKRPVNIYQRTRPITKKTRVSVSSCENLKLPRVALYISPFLQ
jgi:hypothetical protein